MNSVKVINMEQWDKDQVWAVFFLQDLLPGNVIDTHVDSL
jgi:hypothetical protein